MPAAPREVLPVDSGKRAAATAAIAFVAVAALGVGAGYQAGHWAGSTIAAMAAPLPSWPEDFWALVEMGEAAQRGRADRWSREEMEWFVLRLLLASHRYGVPPRLAMSLAIVESGLRWDVVSRRGAVGVMQVLPSTGAELGFDVWDRAQNIEAGVAYLGQLLRRYGGNVSLALAAYNAGPARVARAGYKVPRIRETQNFVRRVTGAWGGR